MCASEDSYKKHMADQHPKPVPVEEIPALFTRRTKGTHFKQDYKCPYCRRVFTQFHNVEQHIEKDHAKKYSENPIGPIVVKNNLGVPVAPSSEVQQDTLQTEDKSPSSDTLQADFLPTEEYH
eukprot:Platyproteum_vivax@DN11279_c0_g1_i1.p1